jgi:hypothetical protein
MLSPPPGIVKHIVDNVQEDGMIAAASRRAFRPAVE